MSTTRALALAVVVGIGLLAVAPDADGNGEATVRGIFDNETFSVSPDTVTTLGREGTPQTGATFAAVNQYHSVSGSTIRRCRSTSAASRVRAFPSSRRSTASSTRAFRC